MRWPKWIKLKRAWLQPRGQLTEEKLDKACSCLLPAGELWQAVLQLIDTAEENANINAHQDIDNFGVCAGYVGGAAHLRMLRDDLEERRQRGVKAMKGSSDE